MNKYEIKGITASFRECVQNNALKATYCEDDHNHYNDGDFLCVKLCDLEDFISELEEYYNVR